MEPTLGEAYWSLANLKTFRFGDAELTAVRALLERTDLDSDSRLHLEFTLGKALEDRALYEESFTHYASGNALRLKLHAYSAQATTAYVEKSMEVWTREFFAAARRCRHRGRRPDLHRRPAALRLDAARADPREPLPGRGHDGVAAAAADRA